jgi:hypothetical protein
VVSLFVLRRAGCGLTLENINPLFLLQPLIVFAFSGALVVYWHFRRSLRWKVLFYALAAYGGAIASKSILQFFTASSVTGTFGSVSVAVGLYFGLQTVVFEVGGAFLVAWLMVSWNRMSANDTEGYGIGLAFGENGLVLGILSLVNLLTYYIVLSTNTPIAANLLTQLMNSQPGLFSQSPNVLLHVGLGVLERVSSLLFHFSWGYLCVVAAAFRKKKYFYLALPMGLVDVLVPFAETIGLVKFELLIFGLGILTIIVAMVAAKSLCIRPELKLNPKRQISS